MSNKGSSFFNNGEEKKENSGLTFSPLDCSKPNQENSKVRSPVNMDKEVETVIYEEVLKQYKTYQGGFSF